MNDRQLQHAIADIARRMGAPEAEVRYRFELALGALSARATVQDYLIVLASRRVSESLRHAPAGQKQVSEAAPAVPWAQDNGGRDATAFIRLWMTAGRS